MRVLTALFIIGIPIVSSAGNIYTYKQPDGTTLFTDEKSQDESYELLSVRKGWSYQSQDIDPALRDAYDKTIVRKSTKFEVDPALVKAVIHAESHFNANAISHAGAQGLMQLMPETAQYFSVNNSFDPIENITGGVRFLSYLQQRFDSLEHVLAAYNAGENSVRKHGGIPPFAETQGYVAKVLELLPRYKHHFSSDDWLANL